MHPASAAEALGRHADSAADLVVQTIRDVHDRFAAAHVASGSPFATAFGTQWRDLLLNTASAFRGYGYVIRTVQPARHKLSEVHGCLVYVWRKPESSHGVEAFASSATRANSFDVEPSPEPLFDFVPAGVDVSSSAQDPERVALDQALDESVRSAMPLVLVVVHSSPRQLQLIEWGVAERDPQSGHVTLHGAASLWMAEPQTDAAASDVSSFDSGVPTPPVLAPRKQEGADPDAR